MDKLDYESYGRTTGSPPNSLPFAFTGRLPLVGNVIYFRNRYYDSAAARFFSEDPLGFVAGLDLYRFVLNNPVSYMDPLGLDPDALGLKNRSGGFVRGIAVSCAVNRLHPATTNNDQMVNAMIGGAISQAIEGGIAGAELGPWGIVGGAFVGVIAGAGGGALIQSAWEAAGYPGGPAELVSQLYNGLRQWEGDAWPLLMNGLVDLGRMGAKY